MSTNHTEHYQLSQWERTDKVLMEDFNADNAKIDNALKAEADARTAAVAGLGNCSIQSSLYVGDGTYERNHQTVLGFSKRPLLVLIIGNDCMAFLLGTENSGIFGGRSPLVTNNTVIGRMEVTWSGNVVRYWNNSPETQMNVSGKTYWVFAFYSGKI